MKLGALLKSSSLEEGTPDEVRENKRRALEAALRPKRVELARKQESWTEIPETRLVPRSKFLIDAETDLVYSLRAGDVFAPGRASIHYVTPTTQLTFYVSADGDVVFLEQPFGQRTWSDIVARRAR